MKPARFLGPTEDKIIELTARYVRVTAEQYAKHPETPSTLRIIRQKLSYLVENDYLVAHHGFSRSGTPPRVYSPSLKGWRYAEEQFGFPIPKRWRPSEAQLTDFRDYLHDLAITDFGLGVEIFCHAAGEAVKFVTFQHDRFLPQPKVTLPDGTEQAMRPDGFLELHIRRGNPSKLKQRCALLEIDRGTHYRKALISKFLSQIAYVKDGRYEEDFKTKSVTYLWVCPDEMRVKELKTLAETVMREHHLTDFGSLFLFTTASQATVDPISLFTQPQWFVPFAPDPVTLLAYVPEPSTVRLSSHYLPQEQYDRFLMATGSTLPQLVAEMDVR